MNWNICDASGRRGHVVVDDITTRPDGSLVGLRKVGNAKPINLAAVFVLARGAWVSAWVDGTEIAWES